MPDFIDITVQEDIARISLNRPQKRNVLHGPLIAELAMALKHFANDATKVLMLTGEGDHFCAGGDLAWMQKMAAASSTENYEDAQALADLLHQLYLFPKPTIVLAHGATMGGGLGLVTAADIALASEDASFALPEVQIGLTPSIISPYVVAAMGERNAHYYFLTAKRFDALTAKTLNIIHDITMKGDLLKEGIVLARILCANSTHALKEAKKLIRYVAKEKITAALSQQTAEHLAELRLTPEAQEGLRAFVEKRKPVWQ